MKKKLAKTHSRARRASLATPPPKPGKATPERDLAPSPGAIVGRIQKKGKTASPPTLVIYRTLPVEQTSSWTIPRVRTALDEHEEGMFTASAKLATALRRDDRIAGCLQALLNSIKGLPFEVKASSTARDSKRAQMVADRVREAWKTICPDEVFSRILEQTALMGFSLAQKRWTLVNGEWLPVLEPWELQHAWWVYQQGLYASTTTGPVRVQEDPTAWFCHFPNGERSWLGGSIRALGLLFIFRQFSYQDWLRFCEKHGVPILTITEPPNLDAGKKKSFYDKVRRLGAESTLRMPKNSKGESVVLSFVEPKDTSWESFQRFIEAVSTSIAIVLLGQNLTTEIGSKGSNAAAQAHNNVRLDVIGGTIHPFARDVVRQVIREYCIINIAGFTDDELPEFLFSVKPPEDQKLKADTCAQYGVGLPPLVQAGIISEVESRMILQEAGILPEGCDPEELPEKPEPPPMPPGMLPPGSAPGRPPPPKPGAGKGGESPPKDGEDDAGKEPTPPKPRVRAALGALGALADEGQRYVDELVAKGQSAAAKTQRDDLDAVLAAVQLATSPEDMRARLLRAHARMNPKTMAELVHTTLMLATLAGRATVRQENPS